MQHPSLRDLQQIDLGLSSNYLSQLASQMLQCQWIDPKLINSFRANLRNAQAPSNEDVDAHQSLLTQLTSRSDPLLEAMLACFGETHLFTNLLRYSLKPMHSQIRMTVVGFTETCLRKAQLFFNRSFHAQRHGQCESSYLASSLFLEMSEQAVRFIESLDRQALRYFHLFPAGVANQDFLQTYYQGLQDSLHLKAPRPEPLLFANDNDYTRELAHRIRQLAAPLKQMIVLMDSTVESSPLTKLRLACDDLSNAAQRIADLNLPTDGHLCFWEGRRLQLMTALTSFIELFDHFSELSHTSFQLTQLQSDQAHRFLVPESFRRSLTLALMGQGHNPHDAMRASADMRDYCSHQNVRPSAIVAAELPKIHPILNEQTLQLLQEIDIDRQLAKKSGPEKQFVLDRSRKLMQVLQSKAHIVCLIVTTALMGCGLKTDTTSKIEDFRPAIPYRQAPAEPPTEAVHKSNQTRNDSRPAIDTSLESDRASPSKSDQGVPPDETP